MTILAVDDEPLIRTLVATVLQDNGYNVLTADCADQAMAVFRERPEDVDLLISDVRMPGMDGPTLAARLQTARPDLQVILMSGYCDCEQLSHGFEFLSKPFTIADILTKVRTLLSGRGQRSGLHTENRASGPARRKASTSEYPTGHRSAAGTLRMSA